MLSKELKEVDRSSCCGLFARRKKLQPVTLLIFYETPQVPLYAIEKSFGCITSDQLSNASSALPSMSKAKLVGHKQHHFGIQSLKSEMFAFKRTTLGHFIN